MKKYIFLTFIIIFNLSFSCENDDEPEQNTEQPGALIATIGDETVDFLYKPSAYFGTINDISGIFFHGSTPDFTKELDISFINFDGVGTYELGTIFNSAYYSTSPPEGGLVTAYSTNIGEESVGAINVTSYNGSTIVGNFNFTLIRVDDPTIEVPVSGTFDLIISD